MKIPFLGAQFGDFFHAFFALVRVGFVRIESRRGRDFVCRLIFRRNGKCSSRHGTVRAYGIHCKKHCAKRFNLASFKESEQIGGARKWKLRIMKRSRMHIFYSGRVQGVGFRYSVKTVAAGYEVTGAVRNLPDGRVELIAEGAKPELEGFRQAIRDAGLDGLIRNEEISWSEAAGEFRGFEIVR
jgi:acylphosphatase